MAAATSPTCRAASGDSGDGGDGAGGEHARRVRPVQDAEVVTAAFPERRGHPPEGVWAAPGRVNLIGEHTDYNDGFVMPFALAQRVTVAAAPRSDDRWSVTSLSHEGAETFAAEDLTPGRPGWSAYAAGVVWALQHAGYPVDGADLVLTSDVPVGAGLSSSAALECAVLTALVGPQRARGRRCSSGPRSPGGPRTSSSARRPA